ncbi:NADP-dependent oxidoreductase [Labilithrix luteola]|nr:NADP-dependent oxidoreductase [Labilithrix luteola]
MMKAVCLERCGRASTVNLSDVPRPKPGPGEVLVHVHAAGITLTELDWGETWRTRNGIPRAHPIPGHELCGEVAAVGVGTPDLHTGDRVYGLTDFARDGAEAEYAIATASEIARAPRSVDDLHAAAVPLAALTAWQALFDRARLEAGHRLLIHGAAGGVGCVAVQLARWAGAHVIGTASESNLDLVRALGADEVVDHEAVHFEDVVSDVDVVLDCVGGDTLTRSFGVLVDDGLLISIAQPIPDDRADDPRVHAQFFVVHPDRAQLERIAELVDQGVIVPIVDAVVPLERAQEAYEHLAKGHARGKTILKVIPS